MNDDLILLQEYARNRSDVAFGTLVSRHVDLVYSVALRRVGAPHLAEEITQTVFVILARKAGTLGKKTILPGWLCRTAHYAGSEALRQQRRRQHHEQEAAMQTPDDPAESTETWQHIASRLDEALHGLGQKDHDALVLRFFQNKNFAEVAAALGASENAAKMRVGRALEKLRKLFTKRGLTLSAAVIGGAVSANSVQAAPTGMAAKISLVAGKGVATTTTVTMLVKGTIKTMNWLKLKFGLGLAAAVLLAGGMVTLAVSKGNGRAGVVAGYFLQGNLTYQVYTVDATGKMVNLPLVKCTFEVFVKGHTWIIQARSDNNPDADYAQTSSDGTNIYYTTKLARGALMLNPMTMKKSPPSSNMLQSVIVETAPVPRMYSAGGDCQIWLAFASGDYFTSLTNNTVMDFSVLNSKDGTQARINVGCRYSLLPGPPHLPGSAEFAHYDYASNGRSSETTNDMILDSRFTSEAITNFNGLLLPTQFRYERYFRYRTNDVVLRPSCTIIGTLTAISKQDPGWSAGLPGKTVFVSDLRGGNSSIGSMYVASNGILPTVAGAQKMKLNVEPVPIWPIKLPRN